jgi:hypothetical protein
MAYTTLKEISQKRLPLPYKNYLSGYRVENIMIHETPLSLYQLL